MERSCSWEICVFSVVFTVERSVGGEGVLGGCRWLEQLENRNVPVLGLVVGCEEIRQVESVYMYCSLGWRVYRKGEGVLRGVPG